MSRRRRRRSPPAARTARRRLLRPAGWRCAVSCDAQRYRRRAPMQRTRSRGAIRSGVLTAASTAAVSGSAAILGVILSRKFGHGVATDGFFAAYNVYLALVLVASALRVVALPRFALARADGRLRPEIGAWL